MIWKSDAIVSIISRLLTVWITYSVQFFISNIWVSPYHFRRVVTKRTWKTGSSNFTVAAEEEGGKKLVTLHEVKGDADYHGAAVSPFRQNACDDPFDSEMFFFSLSLSPFWGRALN